MDFLKHPVYCSKQYAVKKHSTYVMYEDLVQTNLKTKIRLLGNWVNDWWMVGHSFSIFPVFRFEIPW